MSLSLQSSLCDLIGTVENETTINYTVIIISAIPSPLSPIFDPLWDPGQTTLQRRTARTTLHWTKDWTIIKTTRPDP